MGMLSSQVLEDFDACGDHGRLQLHDFAVLHPRIVGEIMRRASDRRGQTNIGVNLDAEALGFSGHGC